MFNLNETQKEFLKKEVEKDQKLLDAIKSKLPDLERVEELLVLSAKMASIVSIISLSRSTDYRIAR